MTRADRKTAAGLIVGLLFLAYFPARFVWDISQEITRGLWSGMAFIVLVAAAVAVGVGYVNGASDGE